MRPDRRKQVEELYHAALGREPESRAAFLRGACGDDEGLYQEVHSLLSFESQADGFMERPAFEIAAKKLAADYSPESLIGRRIGNYEILSLLGRGGMGEVYLAEDRKLGRKVALKFLPTYFIKDAERLRRFTQEARAASALNHPNILTIHEIGAEDSVNFIATEFIDGETLRRRMTNARLKIGEALDTAIQVADALCAAHEAGIVHRDIKPENIMLRRRDSIVKVLDFGVAKLGEQPAAAVDTEAPTKALLETNPGVVVGTVVYMSPEQARGLAVDERTDTFSLGVVVYEMVAGRLPFEGSNTNEILASILSDREPPPLSRYAREVPDELERIVSKALRKNRDERYQTIKDLLLDLRSLKERLWFEAELERSAPQVHGNVALDRDGTRHEREAARHLRTEQTATHQSTASGVRAGAWRGRPMPKAALIAAALLSMLVAGAIIYALFFRRAPVTPSTPEIRSIAVLPLNNLSGDPAQEYFADGMTEALISNLAQIRALKVISRTSVMRYKGSGKSLPEIARELNVDAVIEGSVQRSGGRVRVTAQLIHAATDTHLWARDYEREMADVLKLESEVARAVVDEIKIQVSAEERARLASARSVNPQAHEAYLLGRYHLSKPNEDDLKLAIEYFERAIQLAPDYAAAYAGLSDAWRERGIWGQKTFKEVEAPSRDAALKAIELDAGSAEPHISLSYIKQIYDWDWTGSEQEVKQALEIDPGSLEAHHGYALLLMALGRHPEAIREMQTAEQLDPLSSLIQSNFGRVLYRARRYEEAVAHLKRSAELDPRNYGAYGRMGDAYAHMGKFEEAIAAFKKAGELRADDVYRARTARVYAMMGRQREAREIVSGVKARAFEIAGVYTALGDNDQAFKILQKAVEERDTLVVFVKEDPDFDSLHSDPRWKELLRRMNFPSE